MRYTQKQIIEQGEYVHNVSLSLSKPGLSEDEKTRLSQVYIGMYRRLLINMKRVRQT